MKALINWVNDMYEELICIILYVIAYKLLGFEILMIGVSACMTAMLIRLERKKEK